MNFQEIKDKFDSLSEEDQWKWLLENRDKIKTINTDEDMTHGWLIGDDEFKYVLYFKTGQGWNSLVGLLNAMGINADTI